MPMNVLINFDVRFYRMIHYSAKHSHAIACRPSVCVSVTLWIVMTWVGILQK